MIGDHPHMFLKCYIEVTRVLEADHFSDFFGWMIGI